MTQPEKRRKILHVDMDAFFASVEQRDNPNYRNKPLVVSGNSARAVVAAASYEARTFGIHSAMPLFKARQLCPELVVANHRFDVYKSVSRAVRTIFHRYTDLVEPLSLDEAYLDITENRYGITSAKEVALKIKAEILEQTNLTCSAGVSINKFLAKTASGWRKPNGLTVIGPNSIEAFVSKLPVDKFFGVGKKTASKMHKMGIYTGQDLQTLSKSELQFHFGKMGIYFFNVCRGVDNRSVSPNRVRKSIGVERTLEVNLTNMQGVYSQIEKLAIKLADACTRNDNSGRTLTLKIKFADFNVRNRSKTFEKRMHAFSDIYEKAINLADANLHEPFEIRLLGLSLSGLNSDSGSEDVNEQMTLNL